MHETRRRRKLSPKASIEDEVAYLRDLDLKGLRARWQGVFQQPPPLHLPRHLLFAVLLSDPGRSLCDLDHERRPPAREFP